MNDIVVILLSDKRSGSTFLEDELCKHVGIQHVRYTPHTFNETHYWSNAARLLGSHPALSSNHKRITAYGSPRASRRLLTRLIQGNVPDFCVPDSDEALVFDGWEALCDQFCRPVFFEKSPQHPHNWGALELMLEWASRTSKTVKFIGLIRNPMSVMYSAEKLFHTDPYERQFAWFEANRNILLLRELYGGDSFYLTRYEKIISCPGEEFRHLCEFIGVAPDPLLGSGAHANSTALWVDDGDFPFALHPAVFRLARHFGYEEEQLANPGKSPLRLSRRIEKLFAKGFVRGKSRLHYTMKRVMRR